MPKQAVVLFGAGASIDAGLPSAYRLTNAVYQKLVDVKSDDARLFGIIIAKLQLRNVRRGGAPFDDVNVEEVYDALKKFIGRDHDILAEFVQSWDDLNLSGSSEFDAKKFFDNLANAFVLRNDRGLDRGASFQVNKRQLVEATEALQRAFGGEFYRFRGASLEPFLATLTSLLEVDEGRIGYMKRLLESHAHQISCIATLNYDRVVEQSLEAIGSKFDLGLSQWNEKRFVRFHGKSQRLIKLHGSVDWHISNQDEIVINDGSTGLWLPRAMIFGGQDSKLVPHGPFLHLRHEFQRFLRQENKLLVVGYSFGDAHLNAIIRSWVATRHKSHMMVVNPSGFDPNHPVMAYSKDRRSPVATNPSVSLEVVAKPLSDALPEIGRFLSN
ncbi:SIR2 family protein [Qipengyuania flava]|uniref:SIR2 family protein n=1 Tax=Qipengyuania flava TaxID=192812 RepID=UPI00141AC19C|nr:SIR2 family protein [Qipengyuania flava]NIJ62001.1 hypothetical protein [Qipengyuania flava]